VPGNVPGLMPGTEATYQSYGRSWAHLSNTPFREYKHWVHEGGIATPLVARWPRGLSAERGSLHREPFQLTDVLPTLLDAAGAPYPRTRGEVAVPSAEGRSMLPALNRADPGPADLFWEHEGNSAVRSGPWKLVRKHGRDWELYAIETDRAQAEDPAAGHPDERGRKTERPRTPTWWPTSRPATTPGRAAAACSPARPSSRCTSAAGRGF